MKNFTIILRRKDLSYSSARILEVNKIYPFNIINDVGRPTKILVGTHIFSTTVVDLKYSVKQHAMKLHKFHAY